jgi:hypothetical protein
MFSFRRSAAAVGSTAHRKKTRCPRSANPRAFIIAILAAPPFTCALSFIITMVTGVPWLSQIFKASGVLIHKLNAGFHLSKIRPFLRPRLCLHSWVKESCEARSNMKTEELAIEVCMLAHRCRPCAAERVRKSAANQVDIVRCDVPCRRVR